MKHEIARSGFLVVFAIALLAAGLTAPAHADDHPCSLDRAAGKWSFTDNGTIVGVGLRTAVGVFTLDGNGNVLNAKATSSLNGSVADETFSGTYTVNRDCSGTVSVNIYVSGTEILALTVNIAFDDDMREMRGIFSSVVTSGGAALASVISLQARKQ
jgi:hypothetical protein